jgi:hypothetical protein
MYRGHSAKTHRFRLWSRVYRRRRYQGHRPIRQERDRDRRLFWHRRGNRSGATFCRAHSRSPIVFEDLNFEHRDYIPWMAYGQSKTANILFALALDERAKGYGVRAFSLHPGSIVGTGLSKYLSPEVLRAAGVVDKDGNPIIDPAKNLKTVEQGAATSVWCATSPQLDGMGGVYCQNSDIAPLVSEEIATNQFGSMALGVMPHALDPQVADRLWSLSEQLLGREPMPAGMSPSGRASQTK